MKTEAVFESDYQYNAAGRVWLIPKLELMELPDGTRALSLAEIKRVHNGIANQICGEAKGLAPEEFEFLCEITGTSYSAVAEELQIAPSTLTKWRGRGNELSKVRSLHLKKWFWFKLFGDQMQDQEVHLQLVRDDERLLDFFRSQAVSHSLADEFHEKVA